jgi:hypothetical protein
MSLFSWFGTDRNQFQLNIQIRTRNQDLESSPVTYVSGNLTNSPVPCGSGSNLSSGTGPWQHYNTERSLRVLKGSGQDPEHSGAL